MAGERTDTQIILGAVQDVKEHLGGRIDRHEKILIGTPEDDKPGLVDVVRDINRRFTNMSRVGWIVLTAILTAWGTYMFQAWFHR